ncbi:MAG: hypothetical protein GKS05_09585 [Nitrospirales bacterium]|nr:hypothetical protein [Nitrospirales bacterium]
MAQLSFEVQELLNHVKLLKQKEPANQELIEQYEKLSALLEEAQDKEWNENHQGYLDAKSALDKANAEAKTQLTDLSDLATTIETIIDTVQKVATVVSAVV